ncbi:MAG: SagB/ThcOx family dehydrogenase, partial [Victivallales bacterium]|nr:SagB/ThcOx family dehydrogenase [Victivallales bacterium]
MKKLFPLLMLVGLTSFGQEKITLPSPTKFGGRPLMEALAARHSTRKFKTEPIAEQKLGDLLWAAFGFNRANMRTAPSALNKQGVELYVVRPDGAWRYEPQEHALLKVNNDDVRGKTAAMKQQAFAANAPMSIVFVFDTNVIPTIGDRKPNVMEWAKLDTGFAAQNVYLACASMGLGTCARG